MAVSNPHPESDFPTIADLRDGLSDLIKQGFGGHPVQILVVPDSTLQAIAGPAATDTQPVLMIELITAGSPRLPVGLISMRAVGYDGMPTVRKQ